MCWTFTGDSLKGQGGKTKPDIVVVTELGLNGGTRVLVNAKEGCSVWMDARGRLV